LPDDGEWENLPRQMNEGYGAGADQENVEADPPDQVYAQPEAGEPAVSRLGQVSALTGTAAVPPVPTLGGMNARPTAPASSSIGTMSTGTALMVAEDRARRAEMTLTVIQQSVNLMKNEATRARNGARWAWTLVGVLTCGVIIAVGWTTSIVTRTGVTSDVLHDRVAEMRDGQKNAGERLDRIEDQLASANEARAHAEGQLQEVRLQVIQAEQKAADEARRAQAIEASARTTPATQPAEHAAKGEHSTAGVGRED